MLSWLERVWLVQCDAGSMSNGCRQCTDATNQCPLMRPEGKRLLNYPHGWADQTSCAACSCAPARVLVAGASKAPFCCC
jgi:hypothetical protein